MTSAIYPSYKSKVMSGAPNVDLIQNSPTNGPFVALVDTTVYTYNAAHSFFSEILGVIGPAQGTQITSPSVSSLGVFDGDDTVVPAVLGPVVRALVFFRKNAGAASTWNLVMYYDGPAVPVSPNGGDITISWNSQGIFKL